MINITVEELDIIVQASVEQALTEFKKMVPQIKSSIKQVEENLNDVETKGMVKKVQQAVQQVKQKVNEVKNTGIDKQLQAQFDKAGASVEKYQRQLEETKEKLRQVYAQMDNIQANTWKKYTPEGVQLGNKAIEPTVNNALGDNKQYQGLSKEVTKLEQQITSLNSKLNTAKQEYSQIAGQIQAVSAKQGIWGNTINRIKSSLSSLKGSTNSIKKSFSQLPSVTTKINTKITQMGKGLKQGLGHVLKYAGALFSLQTIYSTLSSAANAWLSSQNAEAQQLNANIEYMKYAMGSALAPVIQFVINLVYQLLKAIQSVAYALTGVNIFANASAKSYASMAGSASDAAKASKEQSKSLAGVHDEINNIQSTENSDNNGGSGSGSPTPSFDLSQLDNTPNSIIDAIKNGDWYKVGATIGEKLNEAMNSIPWNKIQDSARKIGTGIAELLNGFIATTNWNLVGNTFAQGLNTVIYFGYNFVTTFNWRQFGKAIGDTINGFFGNIDWATAGQTLSEGIKGIFNTITGFFQSFDWSNIIDSLITFLVNIDWSGIVNSMFEALGSACASFVNLGMIIGEYINQAFTGIGEYFQEKIEECGGNIVAGILKGIVDALIGIGQWIIENIFTPFIKGFCDAFGIHSPSTVFQEFGQNIIQGLFNGIQSLVATITQIWNNMKDTAINIFNNIKDSIGNMWNSIKDTAFNIWNNITNSITSAVNNIKNGITNAFQTAYNSVTNIFRNIGSFFSNIWNTVRNTFSNLGTNIGNAISNAVKSGINGVISLIQNTINKAIGLINGAIGLINLIPGVSVGRINTISLPRLATGAVLKVPTVAEMAEYPGASQNPEIVTPQNIMEETFDRVLSRYQDSNTSQPIYLTVNVGNTKLGQILLDDLRSMKRRSGKDIEALVGG